MTAPFSVAVPCRNRKDSDMMGLEEIREINKPEKSAQLASIARAMNGCRCECAEAKKQKGKKTCGAKSKGS